MLFPSFFLLTLLCSARALPYRRDVLFSQATRVTALSQAQITDLKPFTFLAAAAYCPPEKVASWKCGVACSSITGFTPTLTGGDGDAVQFFFVGHWDTQKAIVISHEGTDPIQLKSVLTDIEVTKKPLNSTLFPGVPNGVEVHDGFSDQHAKTADQIFAEVTRLLNQTGFKKVITVGHSLGGALAQLQALSLRLNLPSDVAISSTTYGTPRVGNSDYASFFDSKVVDFRRVNHRNDLIPVVPGRFLGFTHPKGEVHLLSDTEVNICPGNDDDSDAACQIQAVPNILEGNALDHLGPYDGIFLGTPFCA
ncbi:alpha/beta-hydrolase [Pluteus cervinus]|uniref:Alpha/beta-hydrolase n=1 Tax=Pluteus cervinus TaxID=181527 RepID=A0ACD3AYL0_9AGAR|nr:alpha/beta-hydrolase [Pluteus cervinus]